MEETEHAVNFFRALADETRLQILLSILHEPLNVSEIHNQVPHVSLSAISHQIRLLYDHQIIVYKKKGRSKLIGLSPKHCWCILRDIHDIESQTSCTHCNRRNYHLK